MFIIVVCTVHVVLFIIVSFNYYDVFLRYMQQLFSTAEVI